MNTPNEEYKLVAKLGNLKTVVHLLKAVNFKEVYILHRIILCITFLINCIL